MKPWEKGVIIKMLGRSIGFKALENRMKLLWAKRGVLNIIDLGQEFYLVTFTNPEDHTVALLEGLWLVYDHYLMVREWSPNFSPSKDMVNQLVVWVRISGLPIEYYDQKVHTFIGNMIGKSIKVDRTNLTRERGKYDHLCIYVCYQGSTL